MATRALVAPQVLGSTLGSKFLECSGVILSVVDDVPVGSETFVVILSISRI